MKVKTLSTLLIAGLMVMAACKKEEDDTTPNQQGTTNNDGGGQEPGITVLQTMSSQSVTGNLSTGEIIPLDWAWSSSMACFVEPGDHHFTGNHVFYQIELPTQSIASIRLIPDNPTSRMALYGYTKASGSMQLPPEVTSCVSCEADPSNNNGSLTGERDIELVAITNPYSIIIGIAGGDGSTEGGFTLEVDIES